MTTLISIAALLLYFFWMMVYWRGGSSVLKSLQEAQSRADLAVLLLLTVLEPLTLLYALYAVFQPPEMLLSDPVRVVGLLLELIGIVAMFYTRSVLGKFWTAEATVRDDHRVVTDSMYGVVRHPIYAFASLMFIGLTIVLCTLPGLILGAATLIAHALKTALEDRYLGEHLPGYTDYQARVRFRLIPGIW